MLTRIDAAAMDAETVQMVSIIDEEKDAHIIINTEGLIQFANKGVANVRLPLFYSPPTPLPCLMSFQHTDMLIRNGCMPNSNITPWQACTADWHSSCTHALHIIAGIWVEQG